MKIVDGDVDFIYNIYCNTKVEITKKSMNFTSGFSMAGGIGLNISF
jgi:hypothetical protein